MLQRLELLVQAFIFDLRLLVEGVVQRNCVHDGQLEGFAPLEFRDELLNKVADGLQFGAIFGFSHLGVHRVF